MVRSSAVVGDEHIIGKEAAELVRLLTSQRLCQVVFDKARRVQRPEERAPFSSSHEGRSNARAGLHPRFLQKQRRPGRRMPGAGRYGCRDAPDTQPEPVEEEQLIYALLCRDKIAQQQADQQRKAERAAVLAARNSSAAGNAQVGMQAGRASGSSARPPEPQASSTAPRPGRVSAASRRVSVVDCAEVSDPHGVGAFDFELEDSTASKLGGAPVGSAVGSSALAAARRGSSLPPIPVHRTSGSSVAPVDGSVTIVDAVSAVQDDRLADDSDLVYHGFATILSTVNSGSREYLESKKLGQLYDAWRESREESSSDPPVPVRPRVCELERLHGKEGNAGRSFRNRPAATPVSARSATHTQQILSGSGDDRSAPLDQHAATDGHPRGDSATPRSATQAVVEGDSRRQQVAARQAFREQVLARRMFGVVVDRDNRSTDPAHEFLLCQQLDPENKHGMHNHARFQELTREAEQLSNVSKRTQIEGFPTLNLSKLHKGPWAMNI